MWDQQNVSKLEQKIEQALVGIFERLPAHEKPVELTARSAHLMAKAAATVYEAIVDVQPE